MKDLAGNKRERAAVASAEAITSGNAVSALTGNAQMFVSYNRMYPVRSVQTFDRPNAIDLGQGRASKLRTVYMFTDESSLMLDEDDINSMSEAGFAPVFENQLPSNQRYSFSRKEAACHV